MEKLSNECLMEAYFKAKKLNLTKEFIDLLKMEINNRASKYICGAQFKS